MSNAIKINRDYRNEGPAPLYRKYDGQVNPQPAYLELDSEGGVLVYADPTIGSGMSFDVWHGRSLCWPIPWNLSVTGIDWMLDKYAETLQKIHDGHTVEWDGSNHVGRLTDEAKELSDDLDFELDGRAIFDESHFDQIWDAVDWFGNDFEDTLQGYFLAKDRSAYLRGLVHEAGQDGVVVEGLTQFAMMLEEELESRLDPDGDEAVTLSKALSESVFSSFVVLHRNGSLPKVVTQDKGYAQPYKNIPVTEVTLTGDIREELERFGIAHAPLGYASDWIADANGPAWRVIV